MQTYSTYTGTSPTTHYVWTGQNTLNMMWSEIVISNPIYATSIDCYWGKYQVSVTTGEHCIWDGNGNLLVRSSDINVSATGWYSAPCTTTYLPGGVYYVGIWRNPTYDMYVPQWTSATSSTTLFEHTDSAPENMTNASATANNNGVLGARINGNPAGMMWINQLGTWEHGIVWINQLGTWKQAQGVWINQSGTWKQSL